MSIEGGVVRIEGVTGEGRAGIRTRDRNCTSDESEGPRTGFVKAVPQFLHPDALNNNSGLYPKGGDTKHKALYSSLRQCDAKSTRTPG